jgi:subtilisin family serine protease
MSAPRQEGGHSSSATPRVIVKFVDSVATAEDRAAARAKVLEAASALQSTRLFKEIDDSELDELAARADDPEFRRPRLENYEAVVVPEGIEPDDMASLLSALEFVNVAYAEPAPEPPCQVATRQGYRLAPPPGVNSVGVAAIAGADGSGVGLTVIDQGIAVKQDAAGRTVPAHDDLSSTPLSPVDGYLQTYAAHGTSVLGIIAAQPNPARDTVGIASNLARLGFVSQWRDAATYSTAQAIGFAMKPGNMAAGDVLLIEAQTTAKGLTLVPAEVLRAVWDAVKLATASGITVIATAGNGGEDLDTAPAVGQRVFNPAAPEYHGDSGAIIVGATAGHAGEELAGHTKTAKSCFGSRIDCYSWGERVYSCAGTSDYNEFTGTSAAAAIIAGVAVAVQGMVASQNGGTKLLPSTMRATLADPNRSTSSTNRQVGQMPDLARIAANLPVPP